MKADQAKVEQEQKARYEVDTKKIPEVLLAHGYQYDESMTPVDNWHNAINSVDPRTKQSMQDALKTTSKPEVAPHAALDKLSQIEMAKARLNSGMPVTQDDVTREPMLAAFMGVKDPKTIKDAIDALDRQAEYYRKFAPQDAGQESVAQNTEQTDLSPQWEDKGQSQQGNS